MHYLEDQNQNRKVDHKNDEVNLLAVFDKIGVLLKRLSSFISKLIGIILKRVVLVLFICALGLGSSYFLYKNAKPYYTSSMTLVLSNIRNEFVENQLLNLSEMIKEDNFPAVSGRLDISLNAAEQIKSMTIVNLDQNRIDEDSILTGSPFVIELSLYDNSLFESMEPAIANYLESNKYFSKQKRIRQRELESIVAKLKVDISSMDSIKASVTSPRGPVNGFVFGEPIDPTNLYRESILMYKQKERLLAELDQLDNIQVVNSFIPRSKPSGPNMLKYLGLGFLLSFAVSVFIAYRLEAKKSL